MLRSRGVLFGGRPPDEGVVDTRSGTCLKVESLLDTVVDAVLEGPASGTSSWFDSSMACKES